MHDPSSTASGRIPSGSGASFHLLPSGASRVDPLCIGIETGADCAIVNRDGVPSRRLFAVGPLARAAFREIIAIPDIRTHCSTLAALLAAQDEERQFERIGAQSP
jgi:uncharacterized NAD(P)/FAD-binding protein YdhS